MTGENIEQKMQDLALRYSETAARKIANISMYILRSAVVTKLFIPFKRTMHERNQRGRMSVSRLQDIGRNIQNQDFDMEHLPEINKFLKKAHVRYAIDKHPERDMFTLHFEGEDISLVEYQVKQALEKISVQAHDNEQIPVDKQQKNVQETTKSVSESGKKDKKYAQQKIRDEKKKMLARKTLVRTKTRSKTQKRSHSSIKNMK